MLFPLNCKGVFRWILNFHLTDKGFASETLYVNITHLENEKHKIKFETKSKILVQRRRIASHKCTTFYIYEIISTFSIALFLILEDRSLYGSLILVAGNPTNSFQVI